MFNQMQPTMDNLSFIALSEPQLRDLFRKELEEFFSSRNQVPSSSHNVDELFTVQQAAEFLNLAEATVYGKVLRKELPVCKRGGRLYFSKSDLIEYVKGGRKKTQEEIEAQAVPYIASKKTRG